MYVFRYQTKDVFSPLLGKFCILVFGRLRKGQLFQDLIDEERIVRWSRTSLIN